MTMAIATPHASSAASAFSSIHAALRDAVDSGERSDVDAVISNARRLVVEAIASSDGDHVAGVREQVRQLAWLAKNTEGPHAEDLAEWDRLLAAALTAADARTHRQHAERQGSVLAERILELLSDGQARRPSDIASQLGATRSQTSRALRALHAGARLVAEPHEHDRRGLIYRVPNKPAPVTAPHSQRERRPATTGKLVDTLTLGTGWPQGTKHRKVVRPVGDRWAVKSPRSRYAIPVHDTQQDAINAARALLPRSGEVVVHHSSGRARSERAHKK